MNRLRNQEFIATASLDQLRREFIGALSGLSESDQDLYRLEKMAAVQRADRYKIHQLIEEFAGPFCGHFNRLAYDTAFKIDWPDKHKDLFEARRWINDRGGGCYFIFDPADGLQYIGSAFTGAVGNRIWELCHRGYFASVDVVLFDSRWAHFSLAFEALAISRLKPKRNANMKNTWIDAPPPWDEIWPKPVASSATSCSEPAGPQPLAGSPDHSNPPFPGRGD